MALRRCPRRYRKGSPVSLRYLEERGKRSCPSCALLSTHGPGTCACDRWRLEWSTGDVLTPTTWQQSRLLGHTPSLEKEIYSWGVFRYGILIGIATSLAFFAMHSWEFGAWTTSSNCVRRNVSCQDDALITTNREHGIPDLVMHNVLIFVLVISKSPTFRLRTSILLLASVILAPNRKYTTRLFSQKTSVASLCEWINRWAKRLNYGGRYVGPALILMPTEIHHKHVVTCSNYLKITL